MPRHPEQVTPKGAADAVQRTFIAVPLPEAVKARLGQLQDQLRDQGVRARWVRFDSIHLTLRFLGDVSASDTERALAALRAAAPRHASIPLTVQGLGLFPGIRDPRVLWAGLGGQTQALFDLWRSVEEALSQAGFEKEKRGFKAHLTLARFRPCPEPRLVRRAVEAVGDYAPLPFYAARIVYYKSDLRPQGAVHTALDDICLARARND